MVATGNIANSALLKLFELNLELVDALGESDFVELRADSLILHGGPPSEQEG